MRYFRFEFTGLNNLVAIIVPADSICEAIANVAVVVGEHSVKHNLMCVYDENSH